MSAWVIAAMPAWLAAATCAGLGVSGLVRSAYAFQKNSESSNLPASISLLLLSTIFAAIAAWVGGA